MSRVCTRMCLALLALFSLAFLMAGCGGGHSDEDILYVAIEGVPQEVNDLGLLIAQKQRSVVSPGGNEWDPGYSDVDREKFEDSDRLAKIVREVKDDGKFERAVAAIRLLPSADRQRVLVAYGRPLYPTWAMNGHIGNDGTTNAGYAVEREIAGALMTAVSLAL